MGFHYRWAGMTTGSIDSAIGRIHFDTVGGRTTAFLPSKQHKGELSTAVPASLKRAAASKNKGASKLSKAAVSVVEEESLSYPEAVREMSTSLPMRSKKRKKMEHLKRTGTYDSASSAICKEKMLPSRQRSAQQRTCKSEEAKGRKAVAELEKQKMLVKRTTTATRKSARIQ